MADKKISALTGATTPLAGSEVLPIVQSGSTVKVSVDNLTAGKTVNTGDVISVKTSAGAVTDVVTVQNLSSSAGTEAGIFFSPTAATGNIRGARITGINDGNNVVGLKFYTGTGAAITSKFEMTADGNLAVSTAGKGITTTVTNGDVTVTPLGTGKTILAKNGLKIPNNAAVTVGTSATQISVNAISWSSLAFVFGVDGGGNAFSDLVFYADGTTTALASRTVSGVPVTRTYTAPAGQLNLAMLSGSYSVFFQHIWVA